MTCRITLISFIVVFSVQLIGKVGKRERERKRERENKR